MCPADALTCFNMLNHRYAVISKSDSRRGSAASERADRVAAGKAGADGLTLAIAARS
ncbi:MAG: hypothetical protein R3B46_04375 [Phycisphaerales bacterium]